MNFEQFTPERGDRPNVRNIAIVVTDGQSNRDSDRVVSDADVAKNRGIQIFSIGISTAVNETELREISSSPQQMNRNWFQSENFQALENVIFDLVQSACSTPDGPQQPDPCQGGKLDLVFLIDSSGSINKDDSGNFNRVLRFLVDLLDKFDVGRTVRVGLISYSQSAENQFFLDTYSDKRSIADRILQIGRASCRERV